MIGNLPKNQHHDDRNLENQRAKNFSKYEQFKGDENFEQLQFEFLFPFEREPFRYLLYSMNLHVIEWI